jgi:hypothetical protein
MCEPNTVHPRQCLYLLRIECIITRNPSDLCTISETVFVSARIKYVTHNLWQLGQTCVFLTEFKVDPPTFQYMY